MKRKPIPYDLAMEFATAGRISAANMTRQRIRRVQAPALRWLLRIAEQIDGLRDGEYTEIADALRGGVWGRLDASTRLLNWKDKP